MTYTKISGVNAMYMFKLNHKQYYFFGDKHYSRRKNDCEPEVKCDDFDYSYNNINKYGKGCISIGALLYLWFLYNNKNNILTDFYLESSFTKENERTALKIGYELMNKRKLLKDYDPSLIDHQFDVVSWMTLFEFLLEPCFIREKTNCPFYPNVHLHYADVRFIDGRKPIDTDPFVLHDIQKYYKTHLSDINFKDFKNLVYILIYQSELIFKMMFSKKNFDHYLTGLINFSSFFNEPMKSLYINKFKNIEEMSVIRDGVKMHRVAAELLKLKKTDHVLSSKIKTFILTEAKHRINRLKIIYEDEDEDEDTDDEDDIQEISYYKELLLPMGALSMDAYILSRMFSQQGKEIIVYAGSNHIATYVKFFKTLKSKIIIELPSMPNNRCLNIKLPKNLQLKIET